MLKTPENRGYQSIRREVAQTLFEAAAFYAAGTLFHRMPEDDPMQAAIKSAIPGAAYIGFRFALDLMHDGGTRASNLPPMGKFARDRRTARLIRNFMAAADATTAGVMATQNTNLEMVALVTLALMAINLSVLAASSQPQAWKRSLRG